MEPEMIAKRRRLADDLSFVARRWRARRDDRLKTRGLSHAQFEALRVLCADDAPLSQAAMADRLGIEPPGVVRLVDGLEALGLVVRTPAPGDRRVNLVGLTARAQALVGEVDAIDAEVCRELLEDIAPAELEATVAIMDRLRASLGAARPLA